MGIPVYWSLTLPPPSESTLKPTLKQTRPTSSSIRRHPHTQRRPLYSEIVRQPPDNEASITSFFPRRQIQADPRGEIERDFMFAALPSDPTRLSRPRYLEQGREEDPIPDAPTEETRTLNSTDARTQLTAYQEQMRLLDIRSGARIQAAIAAATANNDNDPHPNHRDNLLRDLTDIVGSRDDMSTSPGDSRTGVDFSEYFSWMSNSSESTSPTTTTSSQNQRLVQHSPEPIPLSESSNEGTMLDDEDYDDSEDERAETLRLRAIERLEELRRRQVREAGREYLPSDYHHMEETWEYEGERYEGQTDDEEIADAVARRMEEMRRH